MDGWFGNMTGLKYVFPSAPDGLWYHSYKNGCGLLDDCAYEISSIKARASSVAALIQREMHLVGGDSKKVFLAGFSSVLTSAHYQHINCDGAGQTLSSSVMTPAQESGDSKYLTLANN